MTLKKFEKIFKADIANHYIQNQNNFDSHCIHGCLHISRSLIICRLISNELKKKNIHTDIDKISYAVSFHDSGRKANGVDYWETQSRNNCLEYLRSKNIADAEYISSLILKKDNSNNRGYDFLCLYDTDVLEILRPSTGVGMRYFNNSYLKLKNTISYDGVFNEILFFINETERNKEKFSNSNSLINLIDYLEKNKNTFPILYECSNT